MANEMAVAETKLLALDHDPARTIWVVIRRACDEAAARILKDEKHVGAGMVEAGCKAIVISGHSSS